MFGAKGPSRFESRSGDVASYICFAIALILAILGLSQSYHYSIVGSDFTQDYVAATLAYQGKPIYGSLVPQTAKAQLGFDGIDNFHPPAAALFYIPLSFLPYSIAHVTLGLLSCLALVISVAILLKQLQLPWRFFSLVLFVLFAWHPVYETLALGQISLLLAFFITLTYVFAANGSLKVAGTCLAAATSLKLFPAIFLLPLICRRMWPAVFAFVVSGIGILTVTIWLLGFDQISFYLYEVAPRNIREWGIHPATISLHGTLFASFLKTPWSMPFLSLPDYAEMINLLCTLIVFGLTAIFSWKARSNFEHTFSIAACTAILLAPVSWTHNATLLLLPFLWIFFGQQSRSLRACGLISLILFALPSYELIRELQSFSGEPRLSGVYLLAAKAGFLATFILWVALIFTRDKRKITETKPATRTMSLKIVQ